MAKGRKLTSSRSDRLLGSYGCGNRYVANGNDARDFGEDEVWSTVDDVADRGEESVSSSHLEWSSRAVSDRDGGFHVRDRNRISREDRHVGGLSLAFDDSGNTTSTPRIVHQFRGNDAATSSPRGSSGGRHMATSAPVNVPDWSKIYRVDSVELIPNSEDGFEYQDSESEMVPPHEYLARSRKMAATSVFEGAGRTLKGRDMSRVRDAVWRQTGFDG